MQNRMIVVGVLVVGVTALGAGVFFVGGNDTKPESTVGTTPPKIAMVEPKPVVSEPQPEPIDSMETLNDRLPREGREGRRRGGRGGDMFAQMEDRIKKFDLDGDGILSDEERQAMREAMPKERRDHLDLDGDGEISFDERVISQREMMLESDWGQRMAERFDADGDGVLSEDEIAALDQSIAEREQRRIDRELERYDADGDGTLSEQERLTQQQDRDRREEERISQFTSMFDRDGDGNLNEDERVSAFSTMRDRREVGRFLDRYDSNKDRDIGPTEYEAFLSSYSDEEPFADVNRDGRVDAEDIVAFRDYVERAKTYAP